MQQHLCTSCQKNPATVHVLDLSSGNLKGQQHLCQACAETEGVVQPKSPQPLKLSSELLEDLIGGLGSKGKAPRKATGPACAGCGMTATDFKLRGRLGCPRCYDTFRATLLPLLERIHDATKHQGRFPVRTPSARPRPDSLAELRRRLDAAIQEENYEEAANLRDQLRTLDQAGEAS